MTSYPTDLKYTKQHEWAKVEGELIRVGITSFAVEQLGDVTLVDLPDAPTPVDALAHFGDIESVKAVSELYAPVSGEIVEVNEALEASPELVNESPYADGWLVVIRPSEPNELEALMDADKYEEYTGTVD